MRLNVQLCGILVLWVSSLVGCCSCRSGGYSNAGFDPCYTANPCHATNPCPTTCNPCYTSYPQNSCCSGSCWERFEDSCFLAGLSFENKCCSLWQKSRCRMKQIGHLFDPCCGMSCDAGGSCQTSHRSHKNCNHKHSGTCDVCNQPVGQQLDPTLGMPMPDGSYVTPWELKETAPSGNLDHSTSNLPPGTPPLAPLPPINQTAYEFQVPVQAPITSQYPDLTNFDPSTPEISELAEGGGWQTVAH